MAPRTVRQIAFELPSAPPKMTRDAFVIGESNERAVRTMEAWVASPEPFLAICGPESSGKTHLALILTDMMKAHYHRAPASDDGDALRATEADAVIDGADRAASPSVLLAAMEGAAAARRRLVLVGRGDPADWAGGLKDLETRLNAASRITLSEPDEGLLRAVMAKLFRDRQLRASEAIADCAAHRIPKTFAAAQKFVAALDAVSIETGQPIGLKLAREIVANLSEEPFDA